MPTVADPRKLTIAKLKEELQRYNIKLPSSGSKKQVYVDLYLENISQLNDPQIFEDEFSQSETQESEDGENESDEEVEDSIDSEIIIKQPEPKKEMDVEQLTDKELADELRALGFKPGPIGATTRRVYEKKLIKLKQSAGDTSISVSPKLFEKKFTEVPDDEDKQPPAKPRSPRRRPPPRRIPVEEPEDQEITEEPTTQRVTEEPVRRFTEEPVLTRRPMTARGRRTEKTEVAEEPSPKEEQSAGGGIPLWIKLLAFLLVVFFVYLVIANMEPSADSKIPKSITGDT